MQDVSGKTLERQRCKNLAQKIDVTGNIDRQPGSGRPRSACTTTCISEVEDLVLSQEDNQA